MKNIAKTLMMSFCAVLAGCGMTDPWEEWSDEGQFPEDRMVPSEVKAALCAADGWKMTYNNVNFYYAFQMKTRCHVHLTCCMQRRTPLIISTGTNLRPSC